MLADVVTENLQIITVYVTFTSNIVFSISCHIITMCNFLLAENC